MTTTSDPVLRAVPMAADINTNGHIFGGWVLSQMDIAGGVIAGREAQGPVATVAIETMQFLTPILVGDVVSTYGEVERRGRTSVAVKLTVIATRARGRRREEVEVTNGIFTYVALDENHRPTPLPEG